MMITNTNVNGTWIAEIGLGAIIVHLSDCYGHSNQIGIFHNALSSHNICLFLNDGENFDYMMRMKRYDTIFLEKVDKSNDHIFDVYYIKDKACMDALLKEYHVKWF